MNEDGKLLQIELKTGTENEKLEFQIHEKEMGLFHGRAKQRAGAEVKMGEIMKTNHQEKEEKPRQGFGGSAGQIILYNMDRDGIPRRG